MWIRSKSKFHIFNRIFQVCSRLAYECLTAIKRGISSPRFVESDPHFGLLTRTVQYLEREMRGNYRNLVNTFGSHYRYSTDNEAPLSYSLLVQN